MEVPGATYHLTARGNNGAAIFADDYDRMHLLGLLSHAAREQRWTCLAYCLMSNHYHLLVRTADSNLSSGIGWVHTRYVRRFNGRLGRRGHLFGERYHDRRVESDEHLVAAAAYVVLNPVRAGVVARPEEWRWSSYRATVDADEPALLVDVGALLGLLSTDFDRARTLYREVVEDVRSR
jgi:REP element-mobilizing transposase RayT